MSKILSKIFMRLSNNCLVLSRTSKNEIEKEGFSSSKITVLHNTVDVERTMLDFSFKENYIYSLSNYVKSKNLDFVIDLSLENANVNFYLNGSPIELDYFLYLKSKSPENCFLGERVDGVDKLSKIKNAKFLIVPSFNEGMPLIILEALSQGTPVICFNVGYISDYLGEDYLGLVNDISFEAMNDKLSSLLDLDINEYEELSKYSYELFWSNYSPDIIKHEILNVFQ
ncbi:glycosyltransferase family 4 protein [Photobacterium angustum]|nr:glycosyltransferase family 4 protein [Photobacterium angustum]